MYHSEYEMRLLAQYRSAELIAEAARLHHLHDRSRPPRRTFLRSLLTRFRRPASSRTVIDLRERPADVQSTTPAVHVPDASS
jgi:hypothetical protein